MAATRLLIKSGNPAKIYLRFYNGKAFDFQVWTGLFVPAAHWDTKKQRIRNTIEATNRVEINAQLAKLEIAIIDAYNKSFAAGAIINSEWLKSAAQDFFNRPKGEVNNKVEPHTLYLADFCPWWLENKAPGYKNKKSKKPLSPTSKSQYENVVENLIAFEGKSKTTMRGLKEAFFDNFYEWLMETEGYTHETASRRITRVKFFCERAEELGFEISKEYKSHTLATYDKKEYKEPYLNEDEIYRIFKADLSFDKTLDLVRDNFVIALWSGMRLSDFLTRLDISNFQDGYIEIKTLKTGTPVSIPIHPQVKAIIEKHKGRLPGKISEPQFNKKVKIIGQIVEIDDEMLGAVTMINPETGKKRKVVGIYKKYQLLSSHCGRRSMATNLYGKVPNSVIMSVCGWANEAMLLRYIKKTNRENANILKKHWEEKY